MYTIGEFSRITNITIKALRFYHTKGLLVPSYIDETSNYRYYNKKDIDKALVIADLKSMQFNLSEISEITTATTDESDLTVILHQKKAAIDADIKHLNAISSAIDSILIKEREAKKMADINNEIQIKQVPEILVMVTEWRGAYSETGKAMGLLYKAAGRHAAGAPFNLYSEGEAVDIADIESCLPVKKALKGKLTCKTMAGGEFVSLIHTGSYENIGQSYAKIFDYINTAGIKTTLPTREIYLKGPGMIFKGNPDKYLTEIQIQISAITSEGA